MDKIHQAKFHREGRGVWLSSKWTDPILVVLRVAGPTLAFGPGLREELFALVAGTRFAMVGWPNVEFKTFWAVVNVNDTVRIVAVGKRVKILQPGCHCTF